MKRTRSASAGQLEFDLDSLIVERRDEEIKKRLMALPPVYYIPEAHKNKEFKSKPTRYEGVNYRSRTEARWAVLFDLLGLQYVYEIEKVDTQALAIIPDFYLPRSDTWIEVGPDVVEIHEQKQEKAQRLADSTGRPVLITAGFPRHCSHYPWAGCSVALPAPHQVSPDVVDRFFPGLASLREWSGESVRDAMGVARNFQFEAIQDFSQRAA